jgi:hypothetical protein
LRSKKELEEAIEEYFPGWALVWAKGRKNDCYTAISYDPKGLTGNRTAPTSTPETPLSLEQLNDLFVGYNAGLGYHDVPR